MRPLELWELERSPTKILAGKSEYSPWLICKIISEWKFGWTIWYHRFWKAWIFKYYLQLIIPCQNPQLWLTKPHLFGYKHEYTISSCSYSTWSETARYYRNRILFFTRILRSFKFFAYWAPLFETWKGGVIIGLMGLIRTGVQVLMVIFLTVDLSLGQRSAEQISVIWFNH